MNKSLILCLLIVIISSCGGERNYYHNKNGHVRHVKAKKYPPWYTTGERGYDKYSRRLLTRWDRDLK
jgi:hypothetical protein